ncbi:hypothetical protein MED193_03942 [Roseobacter sp. MED193]|nr:hypothetical protein MED193_03942 [Roseobacter sp. MED193]
MPASGTVDGIYQSTFMVRLEALYLEPRFLGMFGAAVFQHIKRAGPVNFGLSGPQ